MESLAGSGTGYRAAFLAAVVGVLAYANSIANGFAYDDNHIIAGNEDIQHLERLASTVRDPYWPNSYGRELGLWRPVTTLVYGLQWALWDGDAAGFHAVNVLLHGFASGLVVVLLGYLMPRQAAFTAGLLFAVHPVHTEAVANVVGMAEILAANLYLWACIVAVRVRGRMRPGTLLGVLSLYLLATLAKEHAITLPGAVLLLDCSRRDVRLTRVGGYLAERGPLHAALAAVAGLVLAGRAAVLDGVVSPLSPLGAEVLASGDVPRVWTILGTWPVLFRLLFMPLDLSADYAPGVITLAYRWTPESVLGVSTGLVAVAVAWATWRTGPMKPLRLVPRSAGFGILWFIITFLPVSNLPFLTGVLLAERTLYLPSVGFCAAAGWMIVGLRREHPRVGNALMAAILLMFFCRTVGRNPVWSDNATVFSTLIREHPESGRAQWLLGDLYFAQQRDRQGLAAYRRAIGLLGGSYPLLSEVGRRLHAAGHERAGEHVLRSAWEQHPELGLAPALLAILYDRQERWQLAEETARAALDTDPTNALHAHILARSLQAQGRSLEAIEARRNVIRLGETHPQQFRWLEELERKASEHGKRRPDMESERVKNQLHKGCLK